MKAWSRLLVAALLAAMCAACPSPPKTRPDAQKVRQGHQEAQQDLEMEEAQRKDTQD